MKQQKWNLIYHKHEYCVHNDIQAFSDLQWMNPRMNEQMNRAMKKLYEWMYEWMHEWMNERVSE